MGINSIFKDKRKGAACFINGKDAYVTFGADLKELVPLQCNVDLNFRKSVGKSKINKIHLEVSTSSYQATFYVVGSTYEECTINSSGLIMELQECILKTMDSEFEYSCVLSSFIVNETGIDFYNEVIVNLEAIRRLPKEIVVIKENNQLFINKGTVESGMKIKIYAQKNVSNIKVCGIKINNIQSGKVFIIDGINGSVTNDGVNALLQTDLIEFPKVKNGVNKVIVSNLSNINVVIEYYPTFLC